MPWEAGSFRSRHNHKLTGTAAAEAAKVATKMVERGVPEGEAIATANKIGDKAMARRRTLYDHPRSRKS